MLPEDRDEIDDQDVEDVKINAREVSIPAQNAFLHSIIQHYHVDGQDGVLNPVGMLGQKLEADFHIIHGVRTRIQNTIRCVKELPLEVEDVVFSALASAQVVLTQHQKNLGALVIDIGGGTTDYILYVDGAVKQSGVLAVGGDHITNDISMGLRIPMARAEKLKIEEGSCVLGNCLPGETILLKDDSGFAGKEIERETLNTIIQSAPPRNIRAAQAYGRRGIFHQLRRRWNFHHWRVQSAQRHRSSCRRSFRNAGARRPRANNVRPDVGRLRIRNFPPRSVCSNTRKPCKSIGRARIGIFGNFYECDERNVEGRARDQGVLRIGSSALREITQPDAEIGNGKIDMIQLSKNYSLPERQEEAIPIKVVGVGSAGSNALDRVVLDGMEKTDLIAINTDVQSLASSVAARKVQLGRTCTRGSRHRRRSRARLSSGASNRRTKFGRQSPAHE